jgi:hypothetical protein
MNIVRGSKVRWIEGTSYIKGRVKKIYEKTTKSLSEQLETALLIKLDNGSTIIKNSNEVEKAF